MSTEILHLLPWGEYKITRAFSRPDWPHLLMTSCGKSKQAFHMKQNPTFIKSTPVVLEDWDDFCAMTAPAPVLSNTSRLMLVEANNPFPYSAKESLTPEQKDDIGHAFVEKIEQFARAQASKEDRTSSVQRTAFLMIVSAIALLSIVFAVIVGMNALGGEDDSTQKTIQAR